MNILLIYGGRSCEHDISIITACLAKGYFDGNIYSAYLNENNVCCYVPNNLTPEQHKNEKFPKQIAFLCGRKQIAIVRRNKILKIVDIDVVVNCCHGLSGEGGSVAALCELCNIPLVGSDIISAAITMDKTVTKQMLKSAEIPVVEGVALCGDVEQDVKTAESLGYPLIVKPSTLGSSIGITLCQNQTELKSALEVAFGYDKRVLCEKALTNFYELNCSAMRTDRGVETSSVERPFTTHDILTFQDKYQSGDKNFGSKVELDDKMVQMVKQLTAQIYQLLGLSGVVRVDFLVQGDMLYVNEVNSIPGSLAYGLWRERYSPLQFGNALIKQAIVSSKESQLLNHKFVSDVLSAQHIGKK